MVDEIDQSVEIQEAGLMASIDYIRSNAKIPVGQPGECIECYEDSPRLVRGVCARCRDRSITD